MTDPDALLKMVDSERFAKATVSITSRLETHEAALGLGAWKDAEGWIARQSRTYVKARSRSVPSEGGALIAAELGRGTESLHIRRMAGGWMATHISENTVGGDVMIVDEVTHVATPGAPGGGLRYRRFWHTPDDGSVEQFAYRFVGFVSKGRDS